jgi:hypothetical protein
MSAFFEYLVKLAKYLFRNPVTVYRDAKSGKFVSKSYAEKNPDTTVSEKVDP